MKTKQGKEVNLSDILLYNVSKNNIVCIVNDEDQMKKFSQTGNGLDAPIVVIPYTKDAEEEIISYMKQIESYEVLNDGNINVSYKDNTKIMFASYNESIIKSNLESQREKSKEKALGNWYSLPEEDKEKKKKDTKKNLKKGLAVTLAAATVAGSLYACSKFGKKIDADSNNNDITSSTIDSTRETVGPELTYEHINQADPRKTEESTVTKSDFTQEAEDLYNETVEKNDFILKYQQISEIKWDKELALEVVEYINGLYPSAMTYMTEENAMSEAQDVHQAILLLIAGNLNSEIDPKDMVDLSQYVVNEKERVLINNAMNIARECVQESIGEPMNGKILDESKWADVNKFSREYTDSVDQLLNYEYDTIHGTEYLTCNAGARFLISSIFQNVNNMIPQWSYITRESSEADPREHDLYYRYFLDDVTKKLYLPEPGPNGTNQYRAYWADEHSLCNEEGPFTEDVMHAMAGIPLEYGQDLETLGVEVNPNIHQLGIQSQVDDSVEFAREDIFEVINKKGLSK